jgi:hypothetical protein
MGPEKRWDYSTDLREKAMKKLVLVVALVLCISRSAMSTPITGNVAIAGASTYTLSGIQFTGPAIVLIGTGNFLPLIGQFVHLEPQILFSNPTGTLFDVDPSGPSMDILTLQVVSNSANFLNVKGTANVSEVGFTTTLYDYTLTDTRPDGVSSFTLTAASTAPIPEPVNLIFLGTGVLLISLFYRHLKRLTN